MKFKISLIGRNICIIRSQYVCIVRTTLVGSIDHGTMHDRYGTIDALPIDVPIYLLVSCFGVFQGPGQGPEPQNWRMLWVRVRPLR